MILPKPKATSTPWQGEPQPQEEPTIYVEGDYRSFEGA
jgi:hypothetical protein